MQIRRSLNPIKLLLFMFIIYSENTYSQNKIFHDTMKLVKGTGVAKWTDSSGNYFGFATFFRSHYQGEFYLIEDDYAWHARLNYQPSCMNYFVGIGVTFLSETGDTNHLVVDSAFYKQVFEHPYVKILNVTRDSSLPDLGGVHPILRLKFGDPSVVPVDTWRRTNLKDHYLFTEATFDNCGNTKVVKYFEPNGKLIMKKKYTVQKDGKLHWY